MAMDRRTKIGIGVVGGLAALALAGGGTALALGGDNDGDAITGSTADQARSAAAAAVPGGQPGEVRAEADDGATYGVDVTRPDGSTVEVHLDGNYTVLGTEPGGGDNDGDGGADNAGDGGGDGHGDEG